MIYDKWDNFKKYDCLNNKFPIVQEFFETLNINVLAAGRIEIDGDDIYANIDEYKTVSIENRCYESHKKYIDIQIMISGHEAIEVTNVENLQINTPYSTTKDIAFYQGDVCGSMIDLTDMYFTIFYPDDAHKPMLCVDNKPESVKKIVVKVRID